MKNILKSILLSFFIMINLQAVEFKNVLVIHSYDKNFYWTDKVQEGIKKQLSSKKITQYVEYMDTKRFVSKEHFENFTAYIKKKYNNTTFDAIITSDNYAYEWAIKHRKELYNNIPIFFCGLNGYTKEQINKIPFVTGVLEKVSFAANIKLIKKLHPNTKKIVFITDDTLTGNTIKKEFLNVFSKLELNIEVEVFQKLTMNELKENLSNLKENTIILLSLFHRDTNGMYYSPETFSKKITYASSVPVYGTWDYSLGHGIVGGYLVSGLKHGKSVANELIEYFDGKDINNIKVIDKSSNQYMFDENVLNKYSIEKDSITQSAFLLNEKFTFYELYKNETVLFSALMLLLILLIILLTITTMQKQNAQERIEKSYEELLSIINAVPHGIFIKDAYGKYLLVNKAIASEYGRTVNEVIGRNQFDLLYDKNEAKNFFKDDRDVIKNKRTIRVKNDLKKDNEGNLRSFDAVKVPFVFDNIKSVLGVTVETTQMREIESKLKQSEQKFHVLFEQAFQFIGLLDMEGILLDANSTSLKFINATKEDVIGKYFWDTPWWFDDVEKNNLLKNAISRAVNGETVRFETFHHSFNGELFIIDFSVKPVNYSDGTNYLIVEGRDISKLKNAEKELEEFNKKLESKVEKRTKELKVSIKKIHETQDQLVQKEKMASLGALVAGVAHEINTPVGIGITGITHILFETQNLQTMYLDEKLEKENFEQYLKNTIEISSTVEINLKRSAELIRSFKKISSDQISDIKREFNLKSYVDEVLISLKPKFKNRKIKVKVNCSENINISSYPGIYAQIITNLILNSLLHAYDKDDNGVISLNLYKDENFLCMEYRDDGKGVTKKVLGKLFDPFFTTARSKGGTGLGLNILFNIITAKLHGTITCSSVLKEGIHFKIVLPL